MTTTENRMRIIETDDLIMESALFRQCFLDEETSSIFDGVDEGSGDEAATECSAVVIEESIVFVAVCRNVVFKSSIQCLSVLFFSRNPFLLLEEFSRPVVTFEYEKRYGNKLIRSKE
jgi:hypothetical protein